MANKTQPAITYKEWQKAFKETKDNTEKGYWKKSYEAEKVEKENYKKSYEAEKQKAEDATADMIADS
ncbi:MAG: hypothetical protein O6761_06920 [Thaumarchaeota archaeon]|nr:hypothetical protein [Nitrososphaerota archaeon]